MWMFPVTHLEKIMTFTDIKLSELGQACTSSSEILKFFGTLILLTRYEFGNRRQLWLSTSKNKYIAAPDFARIMPRYRFDTLRSCIRFSYCPANDVQDETAGHWLMISSRLSMITGRVSSFLLTSYVWTRVCHAGMGSVVTGLT